MKKLNIALIAGVLATSSLVAAAHADKASTGSDLVLKARLGAFNIHNDLKKTPGSTSSFKTNTGYMGEIAADFFVTKNIAIEGAIGYGRTKYKFSSPTPTGNGKHHLGLIPVTATLQYHFMPDASFSPYVGAGYSYQFVSAKNIKNAGAPVAQIGADIPYNETFGFNVDVKYAYKASHGIKNITGITKDKMSTLTGLVGVTFPF